MPLQVSSPLRILVLSNPSTPLPPLLQAHIPVWHETISGSSSELSEWEKEWQDEAAAGEVVRAIGAWVVVVRKPALSDGEGGLAQIRNMLSTISALLAHHTSSSYAPDPNPDPLLLAVGMHQPLSPRLEVSDEAWEDLGRECGGWEWIDGEKGSGGRNEFGEKTGFARLLEALEANDWIAATASSSPLSSPTRSVTPTSPTDAQNTIPTHESEATTALGSKEPLLGAHIDEENEHEGGVEDEAEDEDDADGDETTEKTEESHVEDLEMLMNKMLAVRDLSAEMPEPERRRFAARAVKGIMKDF